jgi:hypothetical protein
MKTLLLTLVVLGSLQVLEARPTKLGLSGMAPQFGVGKIVYIDGQKYPCSAQGFSLAIATVGPGGTIHGEACTKPLTWSETVTIAVPIRLYLPCTAVVFTTQILAVQSDDVHVHGCGSGTIGQLDQRVEASSQAVFTAKGLSDTTDAIVGVKSVRTSIATARLSGFSLEDLLINMNGVGRRAVYTTSCWNCSLKNVVAYNQNCSDGGIYQEADLASDGALFAASYFMRMDNVSSVIQKTNTTCHPFYFDSANGEIAYGIYSDLYALGYPQADGSGSDSIYVDTGSSNLNESFDQNTFINPKSADPSADQYGIKLQCRGDFAGARGGRCFDNTFIDPQPERVFSKGGSGVGIGCVNDAGSADGTGCGFNHVITFSGGNWARNEDAQNMGAAYVSDSSEHAGLQGPINRRSGTIQGNNASFETFDPTLKPTSRGQNLYTLFFRPNVDRNGYTNANIFVGPTVDMADGTYTGSGTVAHAYGLYVNGSGSWASKMWGLYQTGAAGNHLDNFLEIGTAANPNPGGVTNGGRLWYDQDHQAMKLNNDNGGFHELTQTIGTSSVTTSGKAIDAGTCQVQTSVAVTGALTSDSVLANVSGALPQTWQTGIVMRAQVTATNTVMVYLCNPTPSPLTPVATVVRVRVLR